MPKRQHQDNRKYKVEGSTPEGLTSPEPDVTPAIKREFLLTRSADDTLFQAIRLLSRATGTNLSNSHFMRVMLKVVANSMPQLEQEASRLGKLKRPGNTAANQGEREEYEQRMATALASAIAAVRDPEVK